MDVGARAEKTRVSGWELGRAPRLVGTNTAPDLLGTADADVVGDEGLEEPPGPAGVVEHERARDLDLAHRQLPEVPGGAVGLGERGRDDRRSSGRRRPRCRRGRSGRRSLAGAPGRRQDEKPFASSVKPRFSRRAWRLAHSCPFNHTLSRIGEVGADLDEAGPEVGVVDVEVVHPDPAVFLHEVEAHDTGLGRAVLGAEHPLELLGGHDGDDPGATLGLGPLEVGTNVVQLAVVPARPVRLLQREDRHLVLGGEGLHLAAETVADLLQEGRRWDREARGAG